MKGRVTTGLENLEMSENLTAVREMSWILLKLREKSCQGKVSKNCLLLAAYLRPFLTAELVHFILALDHALLQSYPTTDNNTSTGMI